MSEQEMKTAVVRREEPAKSNKLVIVVIVLSLVAGFLGGWVFFSFRYSPKSCNCKPRCEAAVAKAMKAVPPPRKCPEYPKPAPVTAPPKKRLSKLEKEALDLLHDWKTKCNATARADFLNQSSCIRWLRLGNSYLRADIPDDRMLRRRRLAMLIYDELGKEICSHKKVGLDKTSMLLLNRELSSLYSNRRHNVESLRLANIRLLKAKQKPVPISKVRRCYYVKQQNRHAWLFDPPSQ